MNDIEQYFTSLGSTQAPEMWTPSEKMSKRKREAANARRKGEYETALAQYNQNQADYRNFLMAQYSFSKNKELSDYAFERETSYNNPTAQMQRLKAAGLNPNLVNASIDQGNYTTTAYSQASSSAAATPSTAMPQSSPMEDAAMMLGNIESIMGLLGQSYGLAQQSLQNDVTKQLLKEKNLQNQGLEIDIAKRLIEDGKFLDKNSSASVDLRQIADNKLDAMLGQSYYDKMKSWSDYKYNFNDEPWLNDFPYKTRQKLQDDTSKANLQKLNQDIEQGKLQQQLNQELDKSLSSLGEPYASILRTVLSNLIAGFKF